MQRKPNLVMIGCRGEAAAVARDLADVARVQAVEADAWLGLRAVNAAKAEVALLFLDHDPDAALELARELHQGNCAAIVVSTSRDPDTILGAMRAGARDFAHLEPGSADIMRALQALPPPAASVPAPDTGKVITVFGCKGGSGSTTIAVNLAAALREAGKEGAARVVVVDMDLELGDVLVFLDLPGKFTIEDVVENMHRLDGELLLQSLTVHESGVFAISQATDVNHATELRPEDCARVVAFLRDHFDYVVIDGVRDFREVALAALDQSDHVICAMSQDIPSLKNVSRCLSLFKRLDYPENKVRVVINRYRNSGRLTEVAIADALGRRIDGTIANDYPAVTKAVNDGKLLAHADPNGKVYRDIRGLAASLRTETNTEKKRGMFARWGKK